jgi:hypothetical protein
VKAAVTLDGGTATQDETFVINGSNEPPTITSGGGGATATYILSNDAREITVVKASEPDRNDTVTYSLIDAGKHSPFTIDAHTGELSLNHPLAEGKSYTVTVEATDSYGASTTQAITVKVAHDDVLVGAPGNDTFVFPPHFEREVVKKFDPTTDSCSSVRRPSRMPPTSLPTPSRWATAW